MAGQQSKEPDEGSNWQAGTSWSRILARAKSKYQGEAFTNDRSRVRESEPSERPR